MEHQLWKAIVAVLLTLDKPRTPTRFDFSDEDIANVDEALNLKGQIERDNWVGEAQKLLAEQAAAEVPAEESNG